MSLRLFLMIAKVKLGQQCRKFIIGYNLFNCTDIDLENSTKEMLWDQNKVPASFLSRSALIGSLKVFNNLAETLVTWEEQYQKREFIEAFMISLGYQSKVILCLDCLRKLNFILLQVNYGPKQSQLRRSTYGECASKAKEKPRKC